jgi:hypothetical protein
MIRESYASASCRGASAKGWSTRLNHIELCCHFVIISALAAFYVYFSYIVPSDWFGLNQLRHLSPEIFVILVALVVLVWIVRDMFVALWTKLRARFSQLSGLQRTGLLLLGLAGCGFLFWQFRNGFVNPDGYQLGIKIPTDVPKTGAHLTHDEILELFIHSRFWFFTNNVFGWSVAQSYQILSSIGGVIFVALLVRYASAFGRKRAGIIIAGVVSCGFMQLFFGDVENYTLVSVLILVYLYAGHLYLSRRCSIIVPSVILAVAIMFHLLAGWLLPSLVYLYYVSARRREIGHLITGIVSVIVICCGTVAYFHYHGLPLEQLFYNSHVFGHGGHIEKQLADLSPESFLQKTNILFLMVPPVALLIPLMVFGRIRWKPETVFLSLTAFFMLLFIFAWRAMLGVYNDWNLFAPASIPLSILLWYSISQADTLPKRGLVVYAVVALSAMHTYIWIVSNHFLET